MIIQYNKDIQIEIAKDNRGLYARTINNGIWHLISLDSKSGIQNTNGETILKGAPLAGITKIEISGPAITVI
jgi:hypothetical protein